MTKQLVEAVRKIFKDNEIKDHLKLIRALNNEKLVGWDEKEAIEGLQYLGKTTRLLKFCEILGNKQDDADDAILTVLMEELRNIGTGKAAVALKKEYQDAKRWHEGTSKQEIRNKFSENDINQTEPELRRRNAILKLGNDLLEDMQLSTSVEEKRDALFDVVRSLYNSGAWSTFSAGDKKQIFGTTVNAIEEIIEWIKGFSNAEQSADVAKGNDLKNDQLRASREDKEEEEVDIC